MLNRLAISLAFASVTALLLGMLGRFYWPLDLFSHFRVHYIAALLVCGIVLLGIRNWRSGVLALLAATLAAIPTFEYLKPAVAMAHASTDSLRILSLNVWFRNENPGRLARYLEESRADVIVLQEISEREAKTLHAQLASYPHSHTESAALTDTVVFSRWPLGDAGAIKLSPNGVRALDVVVYWRETPITVVGVHLHWPIGARNSARRNGELTGLAELARARQEPLLVIGDLNLTPWSAHFEALRRNSGLADCAASHGLNPTWPSHAVAVGIRIDHCLASSHWRAVDTWVGPHVQSDHRPMFAELRLLN